MFAVKMLLTFFGKNWQGFCVQYVFNFEVLFTNDDISSEPTWPCLFDFLYEIHEELLCWPQVSCHTGIHRSRLSSMLKLFIMVKTPTLSSHRSYEERWSFGSSWLLSWMTGATRIGSAVKRNKRRESKRKKGIK